MSRQSSLHTSGRFAATLALAGAALLFATAAFAQANAGNQGGPDTGNGSDRRSNCTAAPCPTAQREAPRPDCSCDIRRMNTANGVVLVRDCYVQVNGRLHYCEARR